MATEPFQPGEQHPATPWRPTRRSPKQWLRHIRERLSRDPSAFLPPEPEPAPAPAPAEDESKISSPVWLAEGRIRLRHWSTGAALDLDLHRTARASRIGEVALRPQCAVKARDFDAILLAARREGYTRLITIALPPIETQVFETMGFTPLERLDVLKRDGVFSPNHRKTTARNSARVSALAHGKIRIAHTSSEHLKSVFRLDSEGFCAPWQMDLEGFRDALRATPYTRWRVAVDDQNTARGYAITGRTSSQGFLQRVAVDAKFRRQGVASALVRDSLQWLNRHRIHETFVNTERNNLAARALYESFGFVLQSEVLTVLELAVSNKSDLNLRPVPQKATA